MLKTVYCQKSYTMARLSTATRHKVVILHQQGLSQAEISRQTGVSRCAVQAVLKKHKERGSVEDRRCSGRPRKLTYFPSQSEDVQQCHQLRIHRKQWDPGTPIYCPEKSGQKWPSWKTCGQKAIPPTWKQGQTTQLCTKTQELGCRKMAAGALD